ncbi:porin [Limnobacter sp.]|uniref:porin n=1 Tax=Limnobacter sp. TaxID=2003368 RepID=UPI0035146562
MNKKLVAAALGMAFAAPVFADASNVTLYGRVHQVIDHQSTETGNTDRGGNFVLSDASSRLGVRGVEDLGGGLKAVFAYEFAVDSDNGAGITGGRHAYLGLQGSYGTFLIGQQDGGNLSQAPLYNQASLIGSVSNNGGPLTTVSGTTLSGAQAIARSQRASNSIGYSNNIGGVQIDVRHALTGSNDQFNNGAAGTFSVNPTTGAITQSAAATKENGTRETEVAATYKMGALTIGGGFQLFDQQGTDPTTAASPERVVQGIASYNFGSFTLGGLVAQTKLYGTAGNGEDSNTEFALSGTLPLSSNSGIFGMYADSERNNIAAPTDINQLQVAYYYDFSKRTRTYVGFNRLNTEVKATKVETDQDNFTIGLRHNF